MLRLPGLDAIAERVYLAMLARPEASVEEICISLDLTEEQLRTALDRLTELSLMRPSWEGRRSLRVVEPEVGLRPLLAKQQAELLAVQQRVEESCAAVASLIAEYSERQLNQDTTYIERVGGIDSIRDRLFELAKSVREHLATFAPGGGQSPANMAVARSQDQELLARGVVMRTIYLESIENHGPTADYAEWLIAQGGDVRVTPALPLRMIIFDRRTAVLPANPQDTGRAVYVIRSAGMLAALNDLFDRTWREAALFGQRRTRDDEGLTQQERELLRLLTQGLTDHAVAKRLGLSARTVNRVTSKLMQRLDARSRFQAGVEATRRGWLGADDDADLGSRIDQS